jgi:hypothetical protein
VSKVRAFTDASVNPVSQDEVLMEALRLAAILVTLALASPATSPPAHVARAGPVAYRGTGAWIDRYDFEQLPDPGLAVAQMAAHGVRTLYVETASWRVPRDVDLVAPVQTAQLVEAAHQHGMRVVAWYLPAFEDLRLDLRRIRSALHFRTPGGQSFDSFALDIEATAINPIRRRNSAFLKLSRSMRIAAGRGYPLGAIIPDEHSTTYGGGLWPAFPYAAAARYYDVFLPMAYSTLDRAAGARRVYAYTAANVRFVRDVTHRPVHVIGGITDAMTQTEQAAVALAAHDSGAVGASFYKFRLYDTGSWAALSAFDVTRP